MVELFHASGQSFIFSAVLFDVYAPGSGQENDRVEAKLNRKPRNIPAAVGCTTCCDIGSTFATDLAAPRMKQAFQLHRLFRLSLCAGINKKRCV
jgi:hypothetical protein